MGDVSEESSFVVVISKEVAQSLVSRHYQSFCESHCCPGLGEFGTLNFLLYISQTMSTLSADFNEFSTYGIINSST